jgi:hypothetical protein
MIQPRFVDVVEQDCVLEMVRQFANDIPRYIRRFRIEANRMKTVCRKRHHILFPAGNKQGVTFGRQLFQSKTVTVEQIASVQETDAGKRAVDFHMTPALITEYRFRLRREKGKRFAFAIFTTKQTGTYSQKQAMQTKKDRDKTKGIHSVG